jgi:hypothetical protein
LHILWHYYTKGRANVVKRVTIVQERKGRSMLNSVMLIRLANSWKQQAQSAHQIEAETLIRCAEDIVALVDRGAVNAVMIPTECRKEAS